MRIQLNPQRSDATLAISVSGGTIVVNGMAYDLSPLTEGQSISFGVGSAKRDGGITVSLPLPYPHNPSIDPMQVYEVEAADGPVAVPGHDAEQPGEIVPGVIEWPDTSPVVPAKVTRRQARQALLLAGKLDLVQPAIDAMTDPTQKAMAQIEWDDSQDFERSRPLLIALAYAIGLTDEDIDNLFIQAAQL